MDLKRVKKKYWLKLIMSPLTLIPAMGGVTAFFLLGAFGKLFVACIALLAGIGVGIGCFFTNAIGRGEKFLEKAKEETKEEDKRKREDTLDELDQELELDRDPSTNQALSDLRALARAFVTEFDWSDKRSSVAARNLLSIVNKNFGQCVETLRATLRLHNTIRKGNLSAPIKNSLKTKRREMVKKVQENIKNLTTVFEQMQELSTSSDPSAELTKHADDLTRELKLMKRIDERTRALDKKVNLGDVDTSTAEENWIDEFD